MLGLHVGEEGMEFAVQVLQWGGGRTFAENDAVRGVPIG